MPHASPDHQSLNRLLSRLPAAEFETLATALEVVPLSSGQVLAEPNQAIAFAYFPLSAVICLRNVLEGGQSVEATIIGNDGMIGIPLVLGTSQQPMEAVTLIPGEALRISAAALFDALQSGSALRTRLLHYTQFLISQIYQDLTCVMLHTAQDRCCYVLAMMCDRIHAEEIPLSTVALARLVGIRRTQLSTILATLERVGILQTTPDGIIIRDRAALEASACHCYETVRSEFERLLE